MKVEKLNNGQYFVRRRPRRWGAMAGTGRTTWDRANEKGKDITILTLKFKDMKKENTADMVARIAKNGIITEKEVNLIMRRLNAGEKINLSAIWDGEIEVTEEQTAKGLAWLKNLWKTPTGKDRINCPFGYREKDVLEDKNLKMYFIGEYNAGRARDFFIPIYLVIGNRSSFEYFVAYGGIHIIG